MELTKNEKDILKILVKHGRMSDINIAEQLKITTQAVGKIRKRLENKGLIKKYSPILDYSELGLKVFALAFLKIKWKLITNKTEEEVKEQVLTESKHIIEVYSVQKNDITHIVLYGFKDITELDHFFNRMQMDFEEIEIKDTYVFAVDSIIKKSPPTELYLYLIDQLPTKRGAVEEGTEDMSMKSLQKNIA